MTSLVRAHSEPKVPLPGFPPRLCSAGMSNRELAIEIVQQLPPDTPLLEIARKIELRAGIEAARTQVRRGEGQPVEQVRTLVDSWASPSS